MIWRYLKQMFADNGLVEVRALGDVVLSGLFDDIQALSRAVKPLNRSGKCKGIYALLNAPKFRKATNRLARPSDTTKDSDIQRITRLAFDFDPAREAGFEKQNTTGEEVSEAASKALWLRDWLTGKGWPLPLIAMSGNGYHLQYRVNLTPGDDLKAVLRDLYTGLDARCTTAEVSFDTAIRNPARIFRLYGTIARKSEHTAERPQRVATCEVPSEWDLVSLAQIKSLAEEVKPKRRVVAQRERSEFVRGNGDYRTLDVVAWLRAHGFYKRHIEGVKHAIICPWHDEHSGDDDPMGTDTAVWEAGENQWPSFRCLHSHCDGRSIRDVMSFLGGMDAFCSRAYGRTA